MAAPLGLFDSFTEDGFWWITGREDARVAGTLTFNPEQGARLNLLGNLDDPERSINMIFGIERGEAAVIYGETTKGKPVTLFKARNLGRPIYIPGTAIETWSSNLLVIGLHIESADKAIFSKSCSRFEGIENWLGHRLSVVTLDAEENRLLVKVAKPIEEHFASYDDFEVTSVRILYYSNTPDTRYTIDAVSQFGVTPTTPKSLNWHLSKATGLQELASLCTCNLLPLTALQLEGPEQNLGQGMMCPAEVHVYTRLVHDKMGTGPKPPMPLLSGPELVSINAGAVKQWFDDYDKFRPVIGLCLTAMGGQEMFMNVRFLLAIQALEAFHRLTSEDTVMPEADFPAFLKMMTNTIPKSASDCMKEKLRGTYRYLNEPSLKQRLEAMINDIKRTFDTALPAFDKAYIRKLVDTRNYYTNYSNNLKNNKLSGEDMYWASRRIVLLLTILFLKRLGVTGENLAKFLDRHQDFSRLWKADGIRSSAGRTDQSQ